MPLSFRSKNIPLLKDDTEDGGIIPGRSDRCRVSAGEVFLKSLPAAGVSFSEPEGGERLMRKVLLWLAASGVLAGQTASTPLLNYSTYLRGGFIPNAMAADSAGCDT